MDDKRLFKFHLWVPINKKYEVTAHSEIEARNILDEHEDKLPYLIGEEGIEGLNTVVEQGIEVETCIHGHNLEEVLCPECGGCISCVDEGFEIGCGTCRR